MYSVVEEMFVVLSELLSTPGSLKDLPGHDWNQPTTFQPTDRLAQLVEATIPKFVSLIGLPGPMWI